MKKFSSWLMGNQQGKQQRQAQSGRPKKNVHWKSAERPSPPGRPILIPLSDQQPDVVTLKWERPKLDGGSPITGYVIEHRRMGSPHWVRSTPASVTGCEVSISGLEPGWRYQFRALAENVVGKSDPSELSDPLTVTLQRNAISVPRFANELTDMSVVENERVEFRVSVLGQPPPEISWFKDGYEIFSSRRTKIISDNDASVLIIHQVALTDEGEIKCTATNRAGHVVTKAMLMVEAPPKIRLPRNYEDGLIVEADEVLRLKVGIAGQPPPTVFWLHEGEPITNSGRHELETTDKNSTLKIDNVKRVDRGEYSIRAVNKLGDDTTSFLVTVTSKPNPPGKVRLNTSYGKSATLSWTAPDDDGGCKIGSYIVEYFRIGWNVWLKAATTRQLSTTLNDLIEGSEYKFRVKAENPYGLSDPGEESDVLFIPDPKRGINTPDGDDKPVPPRRKTLSPQRALPDGEEGLGDTSPRQRSPMFDRKIKPQILDNEDLVREMSYGTNLTEVRKSSPPTTQPQAREAARRSLSPLQSDIENERKTLFQIDTPNAGSVRRSPSPRKRYLEGETRSLSAIEPPVIGSARRTPSPRSPNGDDEKKPTLTSSSPGMGSGRRTPSPRKPNGEEKKKTTSVAVSTSTSKPATTNPLTPPPKSLTPLIFPMYPPVSPKTPPAIAPAFGPVFTSVVAPVLRFTPKPAPAPAPTPTQTTAPAPKPTPAPLPMPSTERTLSPKPPLSPKSKNNLASRRLLSKQDPIQPQKEQSKMPIDPSTPAKQERPSVLRLRSLSPIEQLVPTASPKKTSSPTEEKPAIPIRNQSLSPVKQRTMPVDEPSSPVKERSPALGVHRKLSPVEQLIRNTLPIEPPPPPKEDYPVPTHSRSLSPVEQIVRNTPPKTPSESKKISSALQRSEEPVDLNESQDVHRYSDRELSPERERQPSRNGNASNPKIHISRPGSDPAPLSDTEKRDEVHTSSEFMLVLFHKNSKVKDKEKQDSFDLDLEEALQPPPISISSPDLASMEFSNLQTFPLRRSVSSTELLYERAMARFYEAVEMEEAERAKKIKVSKEKLAVQPATVRKRLGSISEAERLSFEKRSEMRRRSADIGELTSPNTKWDSKDNIATMRPLSRARGMLNQQFRQDSQETDDASDYQMKTGESFDVESDYTASTDSVSEDSIEKFKRELVARTRSTSDELETYHPRNMSAGVFTPYRAPTPEQSAIVLNRPVPLASPDFVPKPILKRPSNESVVKDESPSPNPIASSSPPLPSSPNVEKEKSKGFKSFFKWDRRSPTEKNTEANAEPPPKPKLQKSISLDSESKRKAREEEERQKQEAARISQEEAKVVVDHYSDIVRQVGSTRKYNPPLYLNREELKKAAERAEKEGIIDDDIEDFIPSSGQLSRLQKPRLSLVERHQIQHVKETASRLAMTINDKPKIPETPSEEDATPSSASQPSQRSESRGRTKIVKVKKIVKKRVPSATRSRDPSSSRPPSSVGASSDDFARRHVTRPRISEPSPVRREYQPAPPQPSLKVNDPEPIAPLVAVPQKSPEELTQEAEEKVRSAVSYMTDVCLFIAACYVYLFKDARLVLPILALMVYRQLGEAIRNNIPDWIKKKKQ